MLGELALVYIGTTLAFSILGVLCLSLYPITRSYHADLSGGCTKGRDRSSSQFKANARATIMAKTANGLKVRPDPADEYPHPPGDAKNHNESTLF